MWLIEDGAPEFVRSLEEKKHWITTVSADVKEEAIGPNIEESSQEEGDENMNEAEIGITKEIWNKARKTIPRHSPKGLIFCK